MPRRLNPQRRYARSMIKVYHTKKKSLDALIKMHEAKAEFIMHKQMIQYNHNKILQSFQPAKRRTLRNLLDAGLNLKEAMRMVRPDGKMWYIYPPRFYGIYGAINNQPIVDHYQSWEKYLEVHKKVLMFLHNKKKKSEKNFRR